MTGLLEASDRALQIGSRNREGQDEHSTLTPLLGPTFERRTMSGYAIAQRLQRRIAQIEAENRKSPLYAYRLRRAKRLLDSR